jgi:hypothetical protein
VLADRCPLATIHLIASHAGFVPLQQIGQRYAVGDIGRRGHYRMDKLAAVIAPEMPLIPKHHWLPFFV